jgi:hypothetical protein
MGSSVDSYVSRLSCSYSVLQVDIDLLLTYITVTGRGFDKSARLIRNHCLVVLSRIRLRIDSDCSTPEAHPSTSLERIVTA